MYIAIAITVVADVRELRMALKAHSCDIKMHSYQRSDYFSRDR
jgi:hypothetical protein